MKIPSYAELLPWAQTALKFAMLFSLVPGPRQGVANIIKDKLLDCLSLIAEVSEEIARDACEDHRPKAENQWSYKGSI